MKVKFVYDHDIDANTCEGKDGNGPILIIVQSVEACMYVHGLGYYSSQSQSMWRLITIII